MKNDKHHKKGEEPTPESSSQELFEEIFKQATMEIKRTQDKRYLGSLVCEGCQGTTFGRIFPVMVTASQVRHTSEASWRIFVQPLKKRNRS